VPQANDAELTELYTAPTGFDAKDNEPQAPPRGFLPTPNFDLHLRAVAGNVVGDSGADYQLTITCIDDTLAAPNAALSLHPLNEQFDSSDGWVVGGEAGNLLYKRVFNISVPADARGHVFHYIATLVSVNREIVSFIESNRFILV